MSDVARLAGVNRVTASVALRGARAGTHVSEATRQRILEAARQLGYTPNAIALALRRQRTDIIGYYTGTVYPNTHDPFTADVINGIQRGCEKYRQDLLMYGGFERRSLDEIYAALSSGKIDGLVTHQLPINPLVERLVESHLPVITLADAVPGIPSVVVDDASGGRLMADFLVARGHRCVMYYAAPFTLTSLTRRRIAFIDRAAAHGMTVHVAQGDDWEGHLGAAERALLLSGADTRPTAVVCWFDIYAYAVLDDCQAMGLRVPEDIAVVGFDGVVGRIRPARYLTTIRAPWADVAERALDLLMKIIDGEEVAAETVFPVQLIIGDTA
ncbi:LacI family transcriptional regulator [Candidatus Gracilibacteria bacterium]|nr:LacI family transcriptional regulator [Candidatus Gracilibacteria bacterium]